MCVRKWPQNLDLNDKNKVAMNNQKQAQNAQKSTYFP